MAEPDISSASSSLSVQVQEFRNECEKRYRFNNRFDVLLTAAGIVMGVAVVAGSTFKEDALDAILGAVVTAIISAQRAFPFAQRARFYRSLVCQSENLKSNVDYNLIGLSDAVKALEAMRLDFAQQLSRAAMSGVPGTSREQAAA